MKLRKITSIVICSSILLGLTGCDALKNMSAKNKKMAKVLETLEDMGFKEYEKKKDIKTGVFESTKEPDRIEEFFDCYEFPAADEDDITRLTFGQRLEESDLGDDYDNQFVGIYVEFADEDDAEDYYDDLVDFYEGVYDRYSSLSDDSIEIGYDENKGTMIIAFDIDDYSAELSVRAGAVLDDNGVYFVLSIGYEDSAEEYADLADDFFDGLKLDEPSSCL